MTDCEMAGEHTNQAENVRFSFSYMCFLLWEFFYCTFDDTKWRK